MAKPLSQLLCSCGGGSGRGLPTQARSAEAGAIRIFCDTKNTVRCNNYYAWEDQRRKRCYIVHVAPRGVNSAILSINITRYAYGNEPEGFQKVDLSPFGAG